MNRFLKHTLLATQLTLLLGIAPAHCLAESPDTVSRLTQLFAPQNSTDAAVEVSGDAVVVKLRPPVFSGRLTSQMQQQFLQMYDVHPFVTLTIELYDGQTPVYSFTVSGEFLATEAARQMPVEQFMEKVNVRDVRSTGRAIGDELAVFPLKLISVATGEEDALIQIEYLDTKVQFARDFPSMNLLVVEFAPWIQKIKWRLLKNQQVALESEVAAEDVLLLYQKKLTAAVFFEKAFSENASRSQGIKGSQENPKTAKPCASNQPVDAESDGMAMLVVLGAALAVVALLAVILWLRRKKK